MEMRLKPAIQEVKPEVVMQIDRKNKLLGLFLCM